MVINIDIKKFPNLMKWSSRKFVIKGKWKLPYMTEDAVVQEEFELFNFAAVMRLSDVEDIELDGRWRYV